ncbi:nuclear transport factor 2 family protein [Ruegeria sp. SCPT10]|uniref:nuclear transport factor 2 family protein n=1 Tax=Ruegeria sp. SCP10 TaxID=3141377 RepID=UPI00333A5761
MQITTPTTAVHAPLIASLYTAVDALDEAGVVEHVTEDVQFQLGNFEQVDGRTAVQAANAGFFSTIQGMQHTITGIWSSGDTAFCDGTVHYTRNDQSMHEVRFAARFNFRADRIADYRVYVDISGL